MTTPYHAKYFAHNLTRQAQPGGVDRLSMALFDACVDLNPHQIEAAMFALRSPLSKGVVLADELGLGKTIEACLVLCQHRAERERKLLVICPGSLRKQWALELDMDEIVQSKMVETREMLLEHFDEDVHARLKMRLDYARAKLDRIGREFWTLTKVSLAVGRSNLHLEEVGNTPT
jgi:SNF2 family DNA or RNA helicase